MDPSVAASSLFTATDPDGDDIITYALKDMTGNGYFVVNGVVQATNVEIDLTAAQLAQTIYQSGSGTDQLAVQRLRWHDLERLADLHGNCPGHCGGRNFWLDQPDPGRR